MKLHWAIKIEHSSDIAATDGELEEQPEVTVEGKSSESIAVENNEPHSDDWSAGYETELLSDDNNSVIV